MIPPILVGIKVRIPEKHYTERPANEWLGAMGSPAIHQLTFDAGGKTSHEQLL